MKIIFSNNYNLKKTLGFIDEDFSFENLLPDILTSTKELMKIIGKDTYDAIADLYTPDFDDDIDFDDVSDDHLTLKYAQNAILSKAMLYYLPNNDLAFTNDGRKMRNEDGEKNPFEWMISKSDETLEKRYYRALNDLITHLDDVELEAWIESDEYKKEKNLFVNTLDIFDKYHPIDSRLLFMKLRPGLEQCEKRYILPRIGKTQFEHLKENRDENFELLDLIYEACINYALHITIPKLSIHILPEGIIQTIKSERGTINSSKVPEFSEQYNAIKIFKRIFEQALNDIETLLQDPEDISLNYQSPNEPKNKFFSS